MRQLSSADVVNLQFLTQVTSAMARATLEPKEVTLDSQVSVIYHILDATGVLQVI